MNNTPEPLSAILSEMRDLSENRDWHNHTKQSNRERVSNLADRIEAAAEREASAPGNTSAMREALEWVADFSSDDYIDDEYSTDGENLRRAAYRARAALAAPARNCDRFADCNSAWKAYNAIEVRERLPGFDFWLFDKAEGDAR